MDLLPHCPELPVQSFQLLAQEQRFRFARAPQPVVEGLAALAQRHGLRLPAFPVGLQLFPGINVIAQEQPRGFG